MGCRQKDSQSGMEQRSDTHRLVMFVSWVFRFPKPGSGALFRFGRYDFCAATEVTVIVLPSTVPLMVTFCPASSFTAASSPFNL